MFVFQARVSRIQQIEKDILRLGSRLQVFHLSHLSERVTGNSPDVCNTFSFSLGGRSSGNKRQQWIGWGTGEHSVLFSFLLLLFFRFNFAIIICNLKKKILIYNLLNYVFLFFFLIFFSFAELQQPIGP